jgi:phenylpyruvate tautomerase PptA (4-oxalocrotonate tautomerase family)
MPHLQFEVNRSVADAAKLVFAEEVRQLFAKVMGSGTDHISISIRECITHDLSIGRVTEPEKGIAIVDADIRRGRTLEQRREEWGHREEWGQVSYCNIPRRRVSSASWPDPFGLNLQVRFITSPPAATGVSRSLKTMPTV